MLATRVPLSSSSFSLPAASESVPAPATLRLRVVTVRQVAEDIRVFELIREDGTALPPWRAGAHLRLQLAGGLQRAYSLCNTPRQLDRYCIAVKREPASRGGSAFLHEQVEEGDELRASPPQNAFPLRDDPRAPLLLAAGIGITPLYAMATELVACGRSYHLHYFARSLAHAAFFAELAAAPAALSLHLGLDAEATSAALLSALAGVAPGVPLYVCGPAPFIAAARQHALACGWNDTEIHIERFGPAANVVGMALPEENFISPLNLSPTPAPETSEDSAFELVLQRSGVRCTVQPGQSIVAAAAQAGVLIGTSCGEGFCGSCESTVLEGQPLHRDSVLSPTARAGGRTLMPCVSRCSGTRLVLDL